MHEQYIAAVHNQVKAGFGNPVWEERHLYEELDPSCMVAFDDVNGGHLDPAKVQKAREAELNIINSIGVWKPILRSSLSVDSKVVSGRWVDTNKRDDERPAYCSR